MRNRADGSCEIGSIHLELEGLEAKLTDELSSGTGIDGIVARALHGHRNDMTSEMRLCKAVAGLTSCRSLLEESRVVEISWSTDYSRSSDAMWVSGFAEKVESHG